MKHSISPLIAVTLTVLVPLAAYADGHMANANIVRMATGTHSFYEEDGTTLRGQEYFRMIVHPDGSRTMMITKNMFSGNRQHNITMRVDDVFRPIDVYSSYWYPEGHKGSVRVTLNGSLLDAVSFSPIGRTSHQVRVPPEVAVITHGEGLNSWNSSVMDSSDTHSGGPVEMERTAYFISAARDGDGPVLGRVNRAKLTRVGEETITVPAGTFETIHYRTGILDVWAMKGDRVMVKQTYRGENYLLTEYNEE